VPAPGQGAEPAPQNNRRTNQEKHTMAIVRYQPFAATSAWQNRSVDALFDRIFENAFGRAPFGGSRVSVPNVSANLYDSDEAYHVELPLPGVKPEDVSVTVQENVLTLRAKRSWETPANARRVWQGFAQGEWQQSFTLPGEVNADRVQASLEHGVLRLELPKADHARPRVIKVTGTGQPAGQIEAASEVKPDVTPEAEAASA
jgi:HSP20 family protein